MIRCKLCEHCGELSFGPKVECSVCGKIRFSMPEIDTENVKNFNGRVKLQCSNCVYLGLDGGSRTGLICLNYIDEYGMFIDWYREVTPTDICSRFIPNEALLKKQ